MRRIIWLSVCLLFVVVSPALGHRLNVFAWLEGANIIVKCNFGSNRPALNADVKVFEDVNHRLIIQGTTNRQGEFIFPLPIPLESGLLIEADAGHGHKGEWKMGISELDSKTAAPAGAPAKSQPVLPDMSVSASPASTGTGISREELKDILTQSLAPLSRQIADLHSGSPGISEIIGGIGWIMGLAGLTFYFIARKKK